MTFGEFDAVVIWSAVVFQAPSQASVVAHANLYHRDSRAESYLLPLNDPLQSLDLRKTS